MLHVPQGYNWYFDSQKRIGERVAILAVLDVAGREVGAVCVHLENKTHAAPRHCRCGPCWTQWTVCRRGYRNSWGTSTPTPMTVPGLEAAGHSIREQHLGMPPRDVAACELLLPVAEEAGFSYWDCNDLVARPRRKPLA